MVGRPEVADDERFFDAKARMEHLPFIQQMMHDWTRTQTTAEVIEIASAMRIPVAPVGNGRNVLEQDHYRERGVFVANPGGFEQPRRPWRLSAVPAADVGRTPAIGEHDEAARTALTSAAAQAPPRVSVSDPRPLAGVRVVDLTAFWAGSRGGRHDGRVGRRHREDRIDPAARRHALRGRGPQRSDVGVVARLPRSESGQARDHARPRQRRRQGPGQAPHRGRPTC